MSEYLKVFPDQKCSVCTQFNCVNTKLFVPGNDENLEQRKVGRVCYDQKYSMHIHVLPIEECPTKKFIDNIQKRVGRGLVWKCVEEATIETALSALDKPIVSNVSCMLVVDKKLPTEK